MSIKSAILTAANKIKVHSPTILLVGGIAAIVGGTVAACVSTTKLETVVDDAKEKLDIIRESADHNIIKKEEAPKLKTQCYLRTAGRVAYLYSVPAILIGAGITAILVSHHVMSKRIGVLTTALNSTTAMFNRYRRNVVAKYGQSIDYDMLNNRYDMTPEQKAETDETNELVMEERDAPWHNKMDRCFDESNVNWSRDVYTNQAFLACQQSHINDILRSRRKEKLLKNGVLKVIPGHITAREVYEELGWTRPEDYRKQDAIVGKMTDGACDPDQPDYLDLGIFESNDKGALQFINGIERSVWLHPNFDGVITDLIGVPMYFKDGKRCDRNGNYI